jgi:hypothetical protein
MGSLGPWPLIIAVSLLISAAFLLLVRAFTDPKAVRQAKDRVVASLLELVLYREDLRVSLGALGRVALWNLRYARQLLWPVVFVSLPFFLLAVQLDCWLGHRALRAGEQTLLEVRFRDPLPEGTAPASLRSSPGLIIETPGLRIPQFREVDWRIRAAEPVRGASGGDVRPGASAEPAERNPSASPAHEWVEIQVGDERLKKDVAVGEGLVKVSRRRVRAGGWDELVCPAEPPIGPGSAIEVIEVLYPVATFHLAGFRVHWLIVFLILTLVFAAAFQRIGRLA